MINNLIKVILLFIFVQGCWFYSIKGSLPAHINSIAIAPIINESAEFSAAVILNEVLNESMMNENVLDIVLSEEADSRLEIVIKSISDKPYTISLSEEGIEEVEQWKLNIKVIVTWYDLKHDNKIFEKQMVNWGSYSPGIDISTDGLDNDGDNLIDSEDSDESGSPRESALNISINRLIDDIVNEITNTW